MAPNRLPVPIKPRRASPQRADTPRNAAVIENDRNRLVTEAMRMRAAGAEPARPLLTALNLLTSKWAEANWRARERLLKAADWIIRLESRRVV